VTPDVSVVMAAWQPRPDWLRAAVRSALAQVGCAVEVVLVDDGSSPAVRETLREIRDDRLRIVSLPHGGVARARNAGTNVARGRFIRYLDADDVLETASTARLLALAKDGTIAYGTTMVCDENLAPLTSIACTLEGDISIPCLLGAFDVRLSWLFPRAVLQRVGDWDARFLVCEDWDFVLRALELAEARCDADAALFYRRHDASLTRTAGVQEAEKAARRVVARYFERHPELVGTRLERRAQAAVDIDKALGYASIRDRRSSLRLMRAAVLRDPIAVLRSAPQLAGAVARRAR
jgi:glycosyltransferase involved in cell wall biosynthesis